MGFWMFLGWMLVKEKTYSDMFLSSSSYIYISSYFSLSTCASFFVMVMFMFTRNRKKNQTSLARGETRNLVEEAQRLKRVLQTNSMLLAVFCVVDVTESWKFQGSFLRHTNVSPKPQSSHPQVFPFVEAFMGEFGCAAICWDVVFMQVHLFKHVQTKKPLTCLL